MAHRIDDPTAQIDKFGPGKNGWTQGLPPVPPTRGTEAWFDDIQENQVRAVENELITPVKSDFEQLSKAIRRAAANIAMQTYALNVTPASAKGVYAVAASAKGASTADGALVAVGDTAEILTSTDGATWTRRTAGGGYTGFFTDVCWDDGTANVVCAVGNTGGIETSNSLMTTWTKRTPDASYSGDFQSVAYGGGVWVAVGTSGEIQTSTDLATWTRRTNPLGGTATMLSVAYGAGRFIAYGAVAGAGRLVTSTNGTTWTEIVHGRTGFTGANLGHHIAYSASLAVWVVAEANRWMRSSDGGTTWTQGTIPATFNAGALSGSGFRCIAAVEDRFIISGEVTISSVTYAMLWVSYDGAVWKRIGWRRGGVSPAALASNGWSIVIVGVNTAGTDAVLLQSASFA